MAAGGFRAAPVLALACAACTSMAVDERTFAGTRWQVTAINGRATPAAGDYHLDFTRRGLDGRFGCNGFGGSYAILGDIITAGDVRSTLMGCSEPAASLEREGFAVLQLPMHMEWSSGTSLRLTNGAGAISLQRAR